MAEGVAAGGLVDAGAVDGVLDCALKRARMDVVADGVAVVRMDSGVL